MPATRMAPQVVAGMARSYKGMLEAASRKSCHFWRIGNVGWISSTDPPWPRMWPRNGG
ncbi:hypothetical protein D9M71_35380 [compost metagenome]